MTAAAATTKVRIDLENWDPLRDYALYGSQFWDMFKILKTIDPSIEIRRETADMPSTSTFDAMVGFLDATWPAKEYIVPCMIGPVGIGKTEAVLEHARNVGANKVVTIIVSQILPNEVSGITMPDTETKAMEIYDHFRLGHLEDGDILFFDELLEGDQMVLSACLTLIESRTMMSGRKLPDIQIVAACNPTIKASMLKPSIRQRFLFREFDIDRDGCRRYLIDKFGVDVEYLVEDIVEERDEYNFLTQRSLTKMVRWLVEADDDSRDEIASQINLVWKYDLGTRLLKKIRGKDKNPLEQVRKVLKTAVLDSSDDLTGACNSLVSNGVDKTEANHAINDLFYKKDFTESDLTEVISILSNLPDWNSIVSVLSSTELKEDEPDKIDF